MFSISDNIFPEFTQKICLTHCSFEYKKDNFFIVMGLDNSIRNVRVYSDSFQGRNPLYFIERQKSGNDSILLSQETKSIIKI